MKRDLHELAKRTYDLVVVGGGIYGACIARDAALRGLSVALLEKGDFGQATSANSLKIIHGGLRYLQDGNLVLVRQMAEERRTWQRIAPHLVRPLPCLMPTTSQWNRSRALMRAGLTLNDLLSIDRNRTLPAEQQIPAGRILGRDAALRLLPELPGGDVTGAVLWHDAQITSTERLLMDIVLSAAAAGAQVANYVQVTGFSGGRHGASGVTALDVAGGQPLQIAAQLTVIAAGVWNRSLLDLLDLPRAWPPLRQSLALNLVTRRLRDDYAIAVPGRLGRREGEPAPGPRTLFVVPWQQRSIIGTLHLPWSGDAQELNATALEAPVAAFLDVVNAAYPDARLRREDVHHVHAGFLPAHDDGPDSGDVRLLRESRIVDHEQADGVQGLLSVDGVKYTTARRTAEEVVDLALRKLRRPAQPSMTHVARLDTSRPDRFLKPVRSGSRLAAEIAHAVREEMAITLADVLLRRLGLGAAGPPDPHHVRIAADLMGEMLGWPERRRRDEIENVYAGYARRAAPEAAPALVS